MQPLHIIYNNIVDITVKFIAHLPLFATAIIVLILTYVIKRIAAKILHSNLKRLKVRHSLIEVFKKILSLGIWIVGILIAAAIIFPSVSFANIITAAGLGSVAIGFAFKDIFENFMAGILILLRETFKIKDYIECQDYEGQVEEITIRDTHIRQSDGQRVVLPNAMLFKNPVTVITDLNKRRTTIYCGVSYDADIARTVDLIQKTVAGTETVLADEGVEIFANKFGNNSIDIEITWWTEPRPKQVRISRNLVIDAVHKALNKEKIEIPFPHREIIFRNQLLLKKDQ